MSVYLQSKSLYLFVTDGQIDVGNQYFNYYREYENATFEISPTFQEPIGMKTNIAIHGVKSGLIINNIVNEIVVSTTEDQDRVEVNLDDYFTGYRRDISVSSASATPIESTSIAYFKDEKYKRERFEFANVRELNQYEVKLIYLKNDFYLYIDEVEFVYLELFKNGIAETRYRVYHSLPEKVRDAKYIPDFYLYTDESKSNGTVIIISSVDGINDVIHFCNVTILGPPHWFQPIVYNIGHVIDVYLYKRILQKSENYLIIGSVSHESHFSLIMFFKEVTKEKSKPDYQYIGEINNYLIDNILFKYYCSKIYPGFFWISYKNENILN